MLFTNFYTAWTFCNLKSCNLTNSGFEKCTYILETVHFNGVISPLCSSFIIEKNRLWLKLLCHMLKKKWQQTTTLSHFMDIGTSKHKRSNQHSFKTLGKHEIEKLRETLMIFLRSQFLKWRLFVFVAKQFQSLIKKWVNLKPTWQI